MALTDDTFYRQRADILAGMILEAQAAIPDVYVGEDGTINIIFTIEAGQFENAFLANQLLADDLFIHTASLVALQQYGVQYGLPIHIGTQALGTLRFEGDGGTYIPIGAEVGYDPGGGLEIVYFTTIEDGTISDPGDPDSPTVAINAVSGNLNGLYEYVVTFVTAGGETLPSDISNAVSPVNQQVNLTAIPIGGPGTTARNIYRDKNGAGNYRRVTQIANNTATTFTDNVTDATVAAGTTVPVDDSAHRIDLDAQASLPGVEGNVAIGTITELTNSPATLISVTNPVAFTGGSDQEDTEDYRQRLLARIRQPLTGSVSDIQSWVMGVDGVNSATVFPNDNMGTAAPGHVTVRISGPGGTIPGSDVVAAAQSTLDALGLAQIAYHVTTFTAVSTNVTVDVTLATGYLMSDVTAQVQTAVSNYINSLSIGGTLVIAGIIDAVFGLAGITDVVVTSPTSNQTTAATSKRTPGTISVV